MYQYNIAMQIVTILYCINVFSSSLVNALKTLIRPVNSLSHEAFGCRVEGRQLHCVRKGRAHLRQNPLVRQKLPVFPINAVLIDLWRKQTENPRIYLHVY